MVEHRGVRRSRQDLRVATACSTAAYAGLTNGIHTTYMDCCTERDILREYGQQPG